MLLLLVVFVNRAWLCGVCIWKLTLSLVDFDANFGDFNQIFQYSILLWTLGLLLLSISNSSKIIGLWFYFNIWAFGYDFSAILHQLHENEILWKKFIVLYDSFWIFGNIVVLYNALHIKRRNEIKDKRRIKLKRFWA